MAIRASSPRGKVIGNAKNETIGDTDNLISDNSGKIIAVVIGVGGFLGLGEKEVAVRFEDLELSRDENHDVKVMAHFSEETLVSAPDFETLNEQAFAVGDSQETEEEQNCSVLHCSPVCCDQRAAHATDSN